MPKHRRRMLQSARLSGNAANVPLFACRQMEARNSTATISSPRIKELTMEHSTTDNSGLIDTLRKAGAIARDGEEGYRRAAEDIDDWQLRSTLLELARGRGEQADEIERLLQG